MSRWPDYRYVNDAAVKAKVKQFLASLIGEITSEQAQIQQ